jgi:hypothetical protein
MASLSWDTAVERPKPAPVMADSVSRQESVLLVAGFADPLAGDYAAYACPPSSVEAGRGLRTIDLSEPAALATVPSMLGSTRVVALVVFLSPQLTAAQRELLAGVVAAASERGAEFLAVVSTFRAHFDGRDALDAEAFVLGLAQRWPIRTVVFRPGHVLSQNSRATRCLRRFGFCFPLVPRRLRTCAVDGAELFAAIEHERRTDVTRPSCRPITRRHRVFTLLGPNRRWRSLLASRRSTGVFSACLTALCGLLALLLVGQVAALVFGLLARWRPSLQRWNFRTLRPRSFRELLALYNPYNYRHVKVVGYNNGVNHFGQRFPGRTVISVIRCDRVVRAGPNAIKADCGATIRKARDFLTCIGKELHVVPNYSYVCLGTSFFIPIHGSAADYSCVADTITKAILYDPVRDRFIAASRADAEFRDHLYNPASEVLLLRLYLRVKDRSRYFVRREEVEGAGSGAILSTLRDERAANVEIRQSNASSGKVQVYRYYSEAGASPSPVLELPRDSLGRLWDRLEENPVTSFLMHALTRHLAFHVELFFTAEEFATFWESHAVLPLRKIQLRYIRRDGMPHSPFRDHDCVSADMFMFRRHRAVFEAYLRRTFAVVRANPGKHSM